MLPKDAEIFLVQAYRVLDAIGITFAIGQPRVEIADGAKTVTAQCEGVRQHADAVLADIERILAEMPATGMSVRHDHFRQRRAVHHRP